MLQILRTADFDTWLAALRDKVGQKQVLARLARLSLGHWGDCKPVGGDAADYLQSDEDCAQYLQACMDEAPEDVALFTKAVGDIARTRGMMQLARDTGITREGLYKALSEQGNPSFATVVKVMHALGLQFKVGARPVQG